ncbi:hypothetical protein PRZ48_013806 [Zasmidium cellare]|uniref:Alpha/beta hydrolase fold-3 domain-containing protein n=1 Tax=Zasmidium cellare TaxID=395010 RepID=A0ABR0E2G4_ZASCE|nr:hypothetical protein PRZ48_013806 [Zasmidium cellare]
MLNIEHLRWASFRAFLNAKIYFTRSAWLSPTTQPDLIKTYPCRPNLFAARIFFPSTYTTQDQKKKLPLLIRAHGGGWIVNNPATDDPMARRLADIVSIDYSKAPQSKFPTAYEDVVEQCLAVLDDADLPIDPTKVVLCGSSAGGNLLLGAAQDPRLRGRVHGVAALSPVVDMETPAQVKIDTRPDPEVPDFIGAGFDKILELYLDGSRKDSRQDVRLSPCRFATREILPPRVLLIGAEHDMFCREAETMAEKLASMSGETKILKESGWQTPGVQWHKILGQRHAFEGFPEKDPQKESARLAAIEELHAVLSEWLVATWA